MTTFTTKRLSGFFALLSLSACMEEFDPASLLAGPRVLGAKVAVEGDETRSTPAPGETATIEWMVTAPGALPPLTWGFVACDGETCALAATGSGTPVRFAWTAPATSHAPRVQILGRICEDSEVALVNGIPACAGGGKGTTATVDVVLAMGGSGNRIPDFAGRAIDFDGKPWLVGTECDAVPVVALGTKGHSLGMRLLAEDRETYTTVQGDPPLSISRRETLQISNFATAGSLSQAFSFVEADVAEEETTVPLTWDAPEVMPATGPQVIFHFVLRDLRGGLAAVTRTVCLR